MLLVGVDLVGVDLVGVDLVGVVVLDGVERVGDVVLVGVVLVGEVLLLGVVLNGPGSGFLSKAGEVVIRSGVDVLSSLTGAGSVFNGRSLIG